MMRKILTTLFVGALLLAGPAGAGWDEGVAAFKAKNYQQAATEFQGVVEQQPEHPSGYLMLGRSLLALKKPNQALDPLRKAAELAPDDPQTRLVLGQALFQAKRYRESAQILGKVDPGSLPKATQATVYQMRGTSYQAVGQLDRAVADLRRAAELANSAKAWYAYGSAAMSNADVRSAVTAFGKAVSLDGNDASMAKAYVNALTVQGRRSRGPAKEQAYTTAVTAAKGLVSRRASYENLLMLAEVQLGAKQYDDAVATLKRAIGENSGDWYAHFYLGQAYTAKKQYPQAEAPLKTALNVAKTTKDRNRIWGQLAFVYEKKKDFPRAIAAYQKAGDAKGAARVKENQGIATANKKIDEHNKKVEELEEEAAELEKELQRLPGGVPPR
jgi:tetratricopeptide (TPR) repeat protein